MTKKYPKTTFIHITVPLRIVQIGPRAWIKKIIGRPIGGYDDNIKRSEFNELLINEYDGKEPICDLAKIESTSPDGKRETFSKDGKTYYALIPNYTYDGGHLNETGRKKAAEQLLILLATQRIRIDCESEANHDLIRLLDKPGVSAYPVYKEISFFELGVGSAFSKSALFSRRGSALTCNRLQKINYFIKVFSSCFE